MSTAIYYKDDVRTLCIGEFHATKPPEFAWNATPIEWAAIVGEFFLSWQYRDHHNPCLSNEYGDELTIEDFLDKLINRVQIYEFIGRLC